MLFLFLTILVRFGGAWLKKGGHHIPCTEDWGWRTLLPLQYTTGNTEGLHFKIWWRKTTNKWIQCKTFFFLLCYGQSPISFRGVALVPSCGILVLGNYVEVRRGDSLRQPIDLSCMKLVVCCHLMVPVGTFSGEVSLIQIGHYILFLKKSNKTINSP